MLISMRKIELRNKIINTLTIHPTDLRHENTILVFLHDALGSIPQWKGFPQQLSNLTHCKSFLYEREGYGNSSEMTVKRDADYLHQYAYLELKEVLDHVFSKEKKFILIGHSDGGTISLLYASKYPKQIKGLVSIAAHVIVEPETLAGISPTLNAYETGKLDGLKKFHGEKTNQLFYAWADTWLSDEFRNWNICDDITPISCPGLLIQGNNDNYGTLKQVELISEAFVLKSELLIIKNCGHHPHLEKTLECLKTISVFLKKHMLLNN
jgi:pimeloyl-ACP methyl ester carboxylesterase